VGGMKRILQGGLLFFVLQLGVTVAYASDNLIIAKILGLDDVAQYSVVSKMFEGVLMVFGLAVTPLWPAYGEAKARGDLHWIKKTLALGSSIIYLSYHLKYRIPLIELLPKANRIITIVCLVGILSAFIMQQKFNHSFNTIALNSIILLLFSIIVFIPI